MDNMNRPSWDESFMLSAALASLRSSCIYLQTGAVIVKDRRIISSGYNGAPPGISNCLEKKCRKDEYNIDFNDKGKSVCRGVHAEINALSQVSRKDLIGTTMYSLYFPCSSCAKAIVGNGLSKVFYHRIYSEPDSLTKELFDEAKIELVELVIPKIEDYLNDMRKRLR